MPREIRTPNELRDLIVQEAQEHSQCRYSYFGAVIYKPPDVNGCNWMLSAMANDVSDACAEDLRPFLADLRWRYNLPEPLQPGGQRSRRRG